MGGSMGDKSVILEGVDSPTSKVALYSTVHGAGRVMSRTRATGKKAKAMDLLQPGLRLVPGREQAPSSSLPRLRTHPHGEAMGPGGRR